VSSVVGAGLASDFLGYLPFLWFIFRLSHINYEYIASSVRMNNKLGKNLK
jgi:hypothetical protein